VPLAVIWIWLMDVAYCGVVALADCGWLTAPEQLEF
jgi:hypothetical protein